MSLPKISRLFLLFVLVFVLVLQPLTTANAATVPSDAPNNDAGTTTAECLAILEALINNGVNSYMPCQVCSLTTEPGNVATAPSADFKPDPQALNYYNNNMKPKLAGLINLYKEAAKAEGVVDWEILAGVHNVESGLARTNKTNSFGFMTIYQMSRDVISGAGANPNDPRFASGKVLNDVDFVFVSRVAYRALMNKAKSSTVKVDMKKTMTLEQVAKVTIAWNAGQNSKWLTGGADPNLMPFAWTGFDAGPRKMPMTYEQGTINKPGTVTTFAFLKQNAPDAISGVECKPEAPPVGGDLSGIPTDRATLVAEILKFESSKNLVFIGGVCAGPEAMRNEIRTQIQVSALRGLLAILKLSGATKVPISCMKVGHSLGGLHPLGLAIDIDYDTPAHSSGGDKTGNGTKIQKFAYANYQALKIQELLWQGPSVDQCISRDKLRKCSDLAWSRIGNHTHHMHIGFNP